MATDPSGELGLEMAGWAIVTSTPAALALLVHMYTFRQVFFGGGQLPLQSGPNAPPMIQNSLTEWQVQQPGISPLFLSSGGIPGPMLNSLPAMDSIQMGLDLAGMVPGIGEIADLVNAGIYRFVGIIPMRALCGGSHPVYWLGGNSDKVGAKKQKIINAFKLNSNQEKSVALISKAARESKAIVIGEGMGTVKATAKTLQSQGINAKWYQAWSKNFPINRRMTPAKLSAAKARNARWLNTKINQGYKIYDIGIDAARPARSPFYQLEKTILQQRGYSTTVLPR